MRSLDDASMDAATVNDATPCRYLSGQQFEAHSDVNILEHNRTFVACQPELNGEGAAAEEPASVHACTNREITCFIYLNDVAEGGETCWFNQRASLIKDKIRLGDFSNEIVRIKPQKGLLVLFYPSCQPSDGTLPELVDLDNQYLFRDVLYTDDMWHSGLPVIDEKYLAATWIWPKHIDIVASLPGSRIHTESVSTDGVVI
jgi:hypothetical protein